MKLLSFPWGHSQHQIKELATFIFRRWERHRREDVRGERRK
jgi:hypothetical protein